MGLLRKLFRKESPTIVVRQEIDYVKLADAIVKAQIKLKEHEEKKKIKLSAAYTLLQLIAAILLLTFGIAIFLFCPVIGYMIGVNDFSLETNIGLFMFALVMGLFSILALAGAREVYISEKKEFINNIFTATMAFASVIIALVSVVIAYRAM